MSTYDTNTLLKMPIPEYLEGELNFLVVRNFNCEYRKNAKFPTQILSLKKFNMDSPGPYQGRRFFNVMFTDIRLEEINPNSLRSLLWKSPSFLFRPGSLHINNLIKEGITHEQQQTNSTPTSTTEKE